MAKKVDGFEWTRMVAFSKYSSGMLTSIAIKRCLIDDSKMKYESQIMALVGGIGKYPNFKEIEKLYNPNWN